MVAGAVTYLAARAGILLLGTGSGIFERTVVLVVAGGASLAVYLAAALLLKIEGLRPVVSALKGRRFVG